MSREVEASGAGISGRHKSVTKAPLTLEPCQHLVEKIGVLRKKIILIHGNVNGLTKLKKVKV